MQSLSYREARNPSRPNSSDRTIPDRSTEVSIRPGGNTRGTHTGGHEYHGASNGCDFVLNPRPACHTRHTPQSPSLIELAALALAMVRFRIQADSDIPASTQLFNQIRFAIASRQFPPGHRLPSTRQLAMETGLHRNTISKVYRQLEDNGLVEAQPGSGIYVRALGHEGGAQLRSPVFDKNPEAYQLVKQSLDRLIDAGCSLSTARELFLGEVDWRLRCSARVIVTAPQQDLGVGEIMAGEIEQSLQIPVQLVAMEDLTAALERTASATIVTSRYFIGDAEKIAAPKAARVIPVDIYDYAEEIEFVKNLPAGTRIGLVSISPGWLRASEVIVHSFRGEEILVMTTLPSDTYKLGALVKTVRYIGCDRDSFPKVKAAVSAHREDIIRPPQVICCENYIGSQSMNHLQRELGLA